MGIGEALYNGLSGLNCYSSGISVVSDNVANANTTAFKSNSIRFGDLVNSEYALRTNDTEGEGSGSMVLGIVTDFSQGMLINTTAWSDMAVSGKGFFIVETPSADDTGQTYYTRDGTFHLDKDGYLVNQQGYRVQGYAITPGTVESVEYSSGSPIADSGVDMTGAALQVTNADGLDVTLTLAGLQSSGNATPDWDDAASPGANANVLVSAINGDTDLADAGVTAALNDTSDGVVITSGNATELTLTASNDAGDLTLDSLGASATPTVNETDATAATELTSIQINAPAGEPEYVKYYVTTDGVVTAVDQDGVEHDLYMIGLAGFENENGLARNGANLYFIGPEVNPANIIYNGGADPNPEYFGEIMDSCVEGSNVDLASEMVNMIVYQAGYNANSKSITTASELLNTSIQMVR
jgi:flagellar hook protein FlgE